MNSSNPATQETTKLPLTNKESKTFDYTHSPYCQKNCKVCNSINRDFIFDMLKNGETYRAISNALQTQRNEKISISSISRHMQNFNRALRVVSSKLDFEKFDAQAENVAKHQKQVLFLMSASFGQIMEQITSGSLRLTLEDFDKLTKLYYNVIQDPNSASDDDIVALFQQASKKQGFDVQQGILFKQKKKSVVE